MATTPTFDTKAAVWAYGPDLCDDCGGNVDDTCSDHRCICSEFCAECGDHESMCRCAARHLQPATAREAA
jgi:hypothetical protein